MGQYPDRDAWGAAEYARIVRNDTEYWVEWVSAPGLSPYEESITALRHTDSPAAAVAVAREVLADIRLQIAQGKIYTNDALTRRKRTKADDGSLYVRVSQPESVYDKAIFMGHESGATRSPGVELRKIALRQYAEYERQINELPAIDDEPHWMLLANIAPDTILADVTKQMIGPQDLDSAYAANPAQAKTLFVQICTLDEDKVHAFLHAYVEHHNGQETWLHEHIAQIPDVDTRAVWARVRAKFASRGNSLIDDFFDDGVLREVWLDLAVEREKKKNQGE